MVYTICGVFAIEAAFSVADTAYRARLAMSLPFLPAALVARVYLHRHPEPLRVLTRRPGTAPRPSLQPPAPFPARHPDPPRPPPRYPRPSTLALTQAAVLYGRCVVLLLLSKLAVSLHVASARAASSPHDESHLVTPATFLASRAVLLALVGYATVILHPTHHLACIASFALASLVHPRISQITPPLEPVLNWSSCLLGAAAPCIRQGIATRPQPLASTSPPPVAAGYIVGISMDDLLYRGYEMQHNEKRLRYDAQVPRSRGATHALFSATAPTLRGRLLAAPRLTPLLPLAPRSLSRALAPRRRVQIALWR